MTIRRVQQLALIVLAGLMLAVAACGGSSKKDSGSSGFSDNPTVLPVSTVAAFPVTVQRSDGKQLVVAAPPKKIVSLSPAATEILYAIGAQGALVAVDKNADYPDAAKNFPTKVDAYEPNIESIAGLQPDLVIVASDTNGLVAKLDGLNIPVLFIDIDKSVKTLDDVLGQIRILGNITGTTDAALPVIQSLGARIRKVTDAIQGADNTTGPKIYHELDSTYYTVSEDTFVGDLYHLLRVRNIAGNGGGVAYPQMTQEAIIASSPNYIILADEDFGVSIDSVKARPGWSAIDAVQKGNIFGINADIISRPGPRIVDALEQLAKILYPSRFP